MKKYILLFLFFSVAQPMFAMEESSATMQLQKITKEMMESGEDFTEEEVESVKNMTHQLEEHTDELRQLKRQSEQERENAIQLLAEAQNLSEQLEQVQERRKNQLQTLGTLLSHLSARKQQRRQTQKISCTLDQLLASTANATTFTDIIKLAGIQAKLSIYLLKNIHFDRITNIFARAARNNVTDREREELETVCTAEQQLETTEFGLTLDPNNVVWLNKLVGSVHTLQELSATDPTEHDELITPHINVVAKLMLALGHPVQEIEIPQEAPFADRAQTMLGHNFIWLHETYQKQWPKIDCKQVDAPSYLFAACEFLPQYQEGHVFDEPTQQTLAQCFQDLHTKYGLFESLKMDEDGRMEIEV